MEHMTVIDTHAHIDQLDDVPGALQRAFDAGVVDIIAVSVDLSAMAKNLSIAQHSLQPRVHVALGVHPERMQEDQQQAFEFIRVHAHEAIAIGETGLDFWYKWVRKDAEQQERQKNAFAWHLGVAREFDLPIIIHSRGAWAESLQMTLAAGVKKAVFHWYSGPLDVLDRILDAGFYVSTSPSVAYSPQSREAMAHAPIERTLIETDTPVTYRLDEGSFQAEPRDVRRTLKAYAQLKGMAEDKAAVILNQNAKDLFSI